MRESFVQELRCPHDGSEGRVVEAKGREADEILTGTLACGERQHCCQIDYGVPNMERELVPGEKVGQLRPGSTAMHGCKPIKTAWESPTGTR